VVAERASRIKVGARDVDRAGERWSGGRGSGTADRRPRGRQHARAGAWPGWHRRAQREGEAGNRGGPPGRSRQRQASTGRAPGPGGTGHDRKQEMNEAQIRTLRTAPEHKRPRGKPQPGGRPWDGACAAPVGGEARAHAGGKVPHSARPACPPGGLAARDARVRPGGWREGTAASASRRARASRARRAWQGTQGLPQLPRARATRRWSGCPGAGGVGRVRAHPAPDANRRAARRKRSH